MCLLPNIKCLLLHLSTAKCLTFLSLLPLWRKAGNGQPWFTRVQARTFSHWQVPAIPKLGFRSCSWSRNSSWYRLSYLKLWSTFVTAQLLMCLCTVCLILWSTLFIYWWYNKFEKQLWHKNSVPHGPTKKPSFILSPFTFFLKGCSQIKNYCENLYLCSVLAVFRSENTQ